MLELQGVTKRYGDQAALGDFDLDVSAGQTTVLIGPSGCGKSTVLRLIVGLIAQDAGRIAVDGRLVETSSLTGLRRRVGYVIQEGGLFPHLTARDNVTLLARHLRWGSDRLQARVAELLKLVQLESDLLDHHPGELSGGQRQRVSLMRALMLDPPLLLLDEPLGALDPMIRFELQQDLRAIFRSLNKTVLMVTHDLGEAAFLGDRIVLIKDGAIIQSGTIADFLNDPASDFVARFVRAQRSALDDAAGSEGGGR